jgi:hypothetical protein
MKADRFYQERRLILSLAVFIVVMALFWFAGFPQQLWQWWTHG